MTLLSPRPYYLTHRQGLELWLLPVFMTTSGPLHHPIRVVSPPGKNNVVLEYEVFDSCQHFPCSHVQLSFIHCSLQRLLKKVRVCPHLPPPSSHHYPGRFRGVSCGSHTPGTDVGESACFPLAPPLLSHKQAHRLRWEMSRLPSKSGEKSLLQSHLRELNPLPLLRLPGVLAFDFQHLDLTLFREGQLAIR